MPKTYIYICIGEKSLEDTTTLELLGKSGETQVDIRKSGSRSSTLRLLKFPDINVTGESLR